MVNPAEADLPESELDLIVAGTDDAILMVEAGANEVTEAEILDALDIAHEEIKKLCAAQRELGEQAGKEKMEIEPPKVDDQLLEQIRASHGAEPDAATQVEDKLERQDATKAVEEAVLAQYAPPARSGAPRARAQGRGQRAFDKLEKDIIRRRIAVDKRRPDGRAADEIREVTAEVGIAPRTHGSGALHPRPDAGVHGRDARHEPRGAAPRHARARDVQALLPPLQLPALLGRGGRLHARAEAPRHRSRGARRAGAGADDPAAWRSSRTRSASSPTSSSRTAPRRWPRCAARRCR